MLVLGGVAAAIAAYCLWASREPTYEGKRLSQWLDEGMKLVSSPDATNQSIAHIVKAVQAIGTNAIPFLLRDMERKEEPRWLFEAKLRAYKLKVMDETGWWSWPLNRSMWGFQALGTNAAPALQRLLVIYDGQSLATGSAEAILTGLGPVAVPELEKRLRSTNVAIRGRAAVTLGAIGPAAESAIPAMLTLLEETNMEVRQAGVAGLAGIGRQPERFVPLFRGLLGDSNNWVRQYAATGLGRFGSSAKEAIPDLLKTINDDTNTSVRQCSIIALALIERPSERLVPLFRVWLSDSNPWIRAATAIGLGHFGSSAKEAIPDLIRATNDPHPDVVTEARQALEQIDLSALNMRSQ